MHCFMMGIQARFGAGWGERVNLKSNEAYCIRAKVIFNASLIKADEQKQCCNRQAAIAVQISHMSTKWDFTDLPVNLMTECCRQVRMEPYCSQKPAMELNDLLRTCAGRLPWVMARAVPQSLWRFGLHQIGGGTDEERWLFVGMHPKQGPFLLERELSQWRTSSAC